MCSYKKLLIAAVIVNVPLLAADVVWSSDRHRPDDLPVPAGTEVAVVGDSITNLTSAELKRRFRDRRFVAPVVSGINGARSDQRVVDAEPLLDADPPEVLVLELGANDIGQFLADHPGMGGADGRRFAESVVANEQTLADRDSVGCVVVVTVNAQVPSAPVQELAGKINDGLDRWAAKDQRVRIADWDALVAEEQRAGEPNGPMTWDTVHPRPYGAARLAELVEDTIDRCPR